MGHVTPRIDRWQNNNTTQTTNKRDFLSCVASLLLGATRKYFLFEKFFVCSRAFGVCGLFWKNWWDNEPKSNLLCTIRLHLKIRPNQIVRMFNDGTIGLKLHILPKQKNVKPQGKMKPLTSHQFQCLTDESEWKKNANQEAFIFEQHAQQPKWERNHAG